MACLFAKRSLFGLATAAAGAAELLASSAGAASAAMDTVRTERPPGRWAAGASADPSSSVSPVPEISRMPPN
eukprot:11883071-Prorocentrum_lima.AAC.1